MVIPIGAIIVACILVGLLFWALPKVNIPEPIKTVIVVVVVVLVVVWIVQASGIGGLRLAIG